MCGISGIYHYGSSKNIDEHTLTKMRDTLLHRGPDDAGNYISPDRKVGLGSRRLKIIDLTEAGHMPMKSETRNIWITYNGEIYNFKELRSELQKRGYIFRSQTDTEVILASYLEYGYDCVKHFNGMFAFAIWDEKKHILFAARDHIGIKPFYYAVQNGTFYFGSEIKAILANPDFKKELDLHGLSLYFTFSATPAPHTLFKNVKKLKPAHYLLIKENGAIEEREYWNPLASKSKFQISNSKNAETYYVERVREILRDSIKKQMVSDVPFGCFLSGGIDSSTNAALMTEALGRPVETFSVGSNYENYNEFSWSRKMAEFLKTKPHEAIVDEPHLREFLEILPRHLEDLNGDYICFPMYYLSKMTRQAGVIVIQVGEGSDEIFAGYGTYLKAANLYQNVWRPLLLLPTFISRTFYTILRAFPGNSLDFHREYLRRLSARQEPFWSLAVAFSDYQKERLLTEQFKRAVPLSVSYDFVNKEYDDARTRKPNIQYLNLISYLDVRHRLPELLLNRADKMTMAHSIEGRVPFLDTRLVELAINMPADVKTKNNETKYILKRAVSGIIPDDIIFRKKQGFSTPLNEWLNLTHPLAKEIINGIFSSRFKETGILNYDYVRDFVNANRYRDNAHIFRLWNLIILSRWYDYWFG